MTDGMRVLNVSVASLCQ